MIHTLSAAEGFQGAEGNMRGSRIFCQFYIVLSLFYSLKRGSNGFIAEKTMLILYKGFRGGPPSRNAALGSCSSCNSAFFFLQNIHHLNEVSRTISVTG